MKIVVSEGLNVNNVMYVLHVHVYMAPFSPTQYQLMISWLRIDVCRLCRTLKRMVKNIASN